MKELWQIGRVVDSLVGGSFLMADTMSFGSAL